MLSHALFPVIVAEVSTNESAPRESLYVQECQIKLPAHLGQFDGATYLKYKFDLDRGQPVRIKVVENKLGFDDQAVERCLKEWRILVGQPTSGTVTIQWITGAGVVSTDLETDGFVFRIVH